MTEVLLVAEAMEDLERLKRAGVLPFALKKLVQLEQNAEIGEPQIVKKKTITIKITLKQNG